MPLYRNGELVEDSYLDLMIDKEPAQIRMIDGNNNPVIMTNIGRLTHQDNKTTLKLLVPSQNGLYLGNPSKKIMTIIDLGDDSSCCVGFRESDKIPLERRFEFNGDAQELLNAALTYFTLVPKEKYEM